MQGVLLIVAIAALAACAARAEGGSPAQLVSALYALHDASLSDGTPGPADPEQRDAFFTARLSALFAAEDALREAEGYGNLDFDPFYNGQDYDIAGLAISTNRQDDGAAMVIARFDNFGQPNEIHYDLLAEPDGWRIDEIGSTDPDAPWILSRLLEGIEE